MTVIEAQAPPAVGRDVEEVLRAGGLSSFHRKAILVTGVAWTFVAMEILLVGFVAPVFAGLWHLNGVMLGLVNSAALAGSLVGSLVLGRTSDRIGRKRIFQFSILWYAVFTACTALSWGPWSVMTFRFLAGLGLGGMLVVDPSLLTEYLPPQRRGRLLVTLDLFWPLGLLLATGLSYVFLVQVGGAWSWRWLFLAASFPAFMAFVARLSLPESPFYLARKGRTEEAAAVLEQITGEPVRRPVVDRLPELEDDGAIAPPCDDPHVVLDEDHRAALPDLGRDEVHLLDENDGRDFGIVRHIVELALAAPRR